MAKDLKIWFGLAFIVIVIFAGLLQYKSDQKPAQGEGFNGGNRTVAEALTAEGISVQWVAATDAAEVEKAFDITLGEGGSAAVILFESRYKSVTEGANKEYVTAITTAFETDGNITHAVAFATNIIGAGSKPILAWANRSQADGIRGMKPFDAYEQLNIRNIDVAKFFSAQELEGN